MRKRAREREKETEGESEKESEREGGMDSSWRQLRAVVENRSKFQQPERLEVGGAFS